MSNSLEKTKQSKNLSSWGGEQGKKGNKSVSELPNKKELMWR